MFVGVAQAELPQDSSHVATILYMSTFVSRRTLAQLYELGPALDESLDPANELYAEVSLVDPVLYLGTETPKLYVSAKCQWCRRWYYQVATCTRHCLS